MKFENMFTKSISGKLGIAKYRTSESTDEEMTPQTIMAKTKAVIERRPFVMSGLHQRVTFVNGGELKAALIGKSTNKKGAAFIQAWIDQRKAHLNQVRYMAGMNWYGQGNVYFEPVYRDGDKAGEMELDNITVVPDSSNIYYNTISTSNIDFWLYRVDDEITAIKYRGETVTIAKYEPYKHSPSSNFFKTIIKAFPMPKKKLFHLKMPYTMDGYYGFSFLMAAVDDEEAINKIIRNLTIISSNKAIGKKIISLQGEKGNMVSSDDIDELENKLDLDIGDNIIINKPFHAEDLASQGTYDTMMPEIDYLTKDIISGLTPSYMTPWNQSMSMANAQQARLPFIMTNEAEKKILEDFWTGMLIGLLEPEAKRRGISLKDIEISFGETQYFSLEERKDFYEGLYMNNTITYNQLLQKLDMETVEGGDIYFRDREAQFDKKYNTYGDDAFAGKAEDSYVDPEEVKVQTTTPTKPTSLTLPTMREAGVPIPDGQYHDYENVAEEEDMKRNTKKEIDEADNEIIDLMEENVE